MKEVGDALRLSKRPTCNFARNTFSTVLKRVDFPFGMISESLGHFPVKSTEICPDRFENEKRAEISKHLL